MLDLQKVAEAYARMASVREAVNRTLKTIYRMRRKYPSGSTWCVNWADLYCAAVQIRVEESGNPSIVAIVEEVSPDSIGLINELMRRLAKVGMADVFIECEW